jgi:hypothetical protein
MFYKKGIDITNDKQMFNFLKGHYTYSTLNSWNGLRSIANNVKIYNLKLSGDCWTALQFLQEDDYFIINMLIEDWEADHRGYSVGFNGRSGGYLVLYNNDNSRSILPDEIDESEDYEEYKRWCKDYCGSVKANRSDLVLYTKLVQDFDRLCDDLRDYCDELSNKKFEVEEMKKSVEMFNDAYYDDLCYLNLSNLVCEDDGSVDCSEICILDCLMEAFSSLAKRPNSGYKLKYNGDDCSFRLIAE